MMRADVGIKLLDGGLSCDLFLSGNVNKEKMNNDPLWVGRVLMEEPDEIKQSHLRFIKAGCDIITTGSYQCSVEGFVKHGGLSVESARNLIGSTVDIAQSAIKEADSGRKISIAASISPYGAILHDMSEYSGSYIDSVTDDFLISFHSTNVKIFLDRGVRLFAIETLPALKEALAVLRVLESEPEARAWISFTTKDGLTTSYGDEFKKVFQTLSSNKQVIAVGTNCSDSNLVLKQVLTAKIYLGSHQSYVCYPNQNFESYFEKHQGSHDDLSWKNDIRSWFETGVFGFIGGCCLVEPKHIAMIRQEIDTYQG